MTDTTAPKKARAPRKSATKAPVQEAEVIDTPEIQMESPVSKGELAPVITTTTAVGSRISETFNADPEKVRAAAKAINIKDTNSIITFGVGSQKQITAVTDEMLKGVKNKDLGPISNEMTNMVVSLKKMDFKALTKGESKMPGFIKKIFGLGTALAKFKAQYDTVEESVARSESNLQGHRMTLLKDIRMLDVMYQRTEEYLDELEVLILAGEQVLEELDTRAIPEARIQAETTKDMQDAQSLRDLTNARDSLERKVHDLKLTRQITIQALPSIRVVQDNDRNMAEQIQSQILNTLPLWKQQMVIAVSVHHGREAAKASKQVSDFTNELVVTTSEQLRLGNKETRQQIERGIVDIESIKKANENLIGTIQDSLEIAAQGKAARAAAEVELLNAENALKGALVQASNQQAQLTKS